MGDPFTIAANAFTRPPVAAQALFFSHGGGQGKGLRVEVQDLGLEFTDNAYIGTDPEGMLYYNDKSDFTVKQDNYGRTIAHNYTVKSLTYGAVTYAIIEWSKSYDTKPYAKFVAKDAANVAARMANYSHSGEWIKLSLGTFNATVEKTSANEVQISINVIGKTGRWTTSAALSTTKIQGRGCHLFQSLV